MGHHMAANLAKKANSPLVIHDVNRAACQAFVKTYSNAKSADSPKDVAREADVIITMLPSSPHVRSVYLDEKTGLIAGLQSDRRALLIDSSTIDPKTSQDVAAAVRKHAANVTAVDAPVSGGVLGAESGTLTFMVGSTPDEFDRVKSLLAFMGKNIVHCGPQGLGQVAKICNNMLLGISMIAVSETMNLGCRLGMDPKVLSGIINTSSGRCWSSEIYNPVPGILPNVPSSRGYNGGFGVHLMAKDMGLAVQAALNSKSTIFLGSLSKHLYDTVHHSSVENEKNESESLYGKDFSVVYKWLERSDKKQ
jgi:3-hydroxyisobutyrate dehydrogenase